MARLNADQVRGIWAGATMTWNEDFSFNEELYAKNVKSFIDASVHGIYTTGSTGEFYAIDFDEFCRMVDIQDELCGQAGMPLQIGCCSDATHKTLRRLEYINGKKHVGAAQIAIPYWMELNDRELLEFFKTLNTACPEMPLVLYNIPRSKRFLDGDDLLRILDVAPNLIGVKFVFAGSNFGKLQTALQKVPNISYFVGENFLVSAMMLGARGCYSSLVGTNPAWTMKMYALAEQRKWDEAIEMQLHVNRFFNEAAAFIMERGEGTIDPVFDKGLSVACGCANGHQRTRPPYIGWSDETIAALQTWLKANHPEYLYHA